MTIVGEPGRDNRTPSQVLLDMYQPHIHHVAFVKMKGRTPGPGEDRFETDVEVDGHSFHVIRLRVGGYDQFTATVNDPPPAAEEV